MEEAGNGQPATIAENEAAAPSLGAVFAASKFIAKASRNRRSREAQRLTNEWASRGASSRSYSSVTDDAVGLEEAADNGMYVSGKSLDGEEDGGDDASEIFKIWSMISDKWINVMMIFVPAGFAVKWLGCSETTIFVVNFLAMVPLASILGDFTEEVAAHTNQTLGGLIQATLGNAVEIVVSIQALYANQIRVVQASLLGSVFSNMLLVLGCCFFFGGLKHKEQRFNSTSAIANMSLLLLSSLALVLPTPLSHAAEMGDLLTVSRFSGVFLLIMYVQLLVFQFKTHAYLFANNDEDGTNLKLVTSLMGLAVVTGLVAWLSEFLVDAIDGFTEEAHLSKSFVGLILLPIIGNAVEHITAITVAVKNKMELAMGVAVGSATQVSMFVVPVAVLSGWAMDREMTLMFPNEEIILYVLSIVIVSTAVSNGTSNWLQGSLLVTTYVLVAVACWYEDRGHGIGEELPLPPP
ncbi:unnamed protein product [Ectocarpus sp. 12 AP-2014]